MRKNYETIICGEKVVLVPYRPEHVETYHEWMKSPFLLEMTGSEPLSYEEEVEMQMTWRDDEDKCTFILLSRDLCYEYLVEAVITEEMMLMTSEERSIDASFIPKSLCAMIGDINLFLSEEEEDENESERDDTSGAEHRRRMQAELDVMVAEESFRGKGIGKEAVCIMMLYGAEELGIRKFVVKVNETNVASRFLFEKSLGFKETNYAACFNQYEYVFQRPTPSDIIAEIREKHRIPTSRLMLKITNRWHDTH